MAQGWRVETRGNGHLGFFPPTGKPVFIGSTPSDVRAVSNMKAALRRAGLQIDGRPTPPKTNGHGLTGGIRLAGQRCPHDGTQCINKCEDDGACQRLSRGEISTLRMPGYPKPEYETAAKWLLEGRPDRAQAKVASFAPAPNEGHTSRLAPNPDEELHVFLKRAREARGLSQDRLVARLQGKMTQAHLSGVERDVRRVSETMLEALIEALHLDATATRTLYEATPKRKVSAPKSQKPKTRGVKPTAYVAEARKLAEEQGIDWRGVGLPETPLYTDRDKQPFSHDEIQWLIVFLANKYPAARIAWALGRDALKPDSLMRAFRKFRKTPPPIDAVGAGAVLKIVGAVAPPEPEPTTAPEPEPAAPPDTLPAPERLGAIHVCPKCSGTGRVDGAVCPVPICRGRGVVVV